MDEQKQETRLIFTVGETARMLGLSRASTYEAIKRKEIPSIKFGRRILVPKAALIKMLGEVSVP